MTIYIIIEEEIYSDRSRVGKVYSSEKRAKAHAKKEEKRMDKAYKKRMYSDYDKNFFGISYVAKEIEE